MTRKTREPPAEAAPLTRPAQVEALLAKQGIYSTQIRSMVIARLHELGRSITTLDGKALPARLVLAHPEHILEAFDDILATNASVADWVADERQREAQRRQQQAQLDAANAHAARLLNGAS